MTQERVVANGPSNTERQRAPRSDGHARPRNAISTSALGRGPQIYQPICVSKLIVVEKGDPSASRVADAGIAGRRHTDIPGMPHVPDLDGGAGRRLRDDCPSIVGGRIIYDDYVI